MKLNAKIIGAGLAGCEAAYQLASRGVNVQLYECKSIEKSPAHTFDTFAELVCSNSLKSQELSTGSGLLKEEITRLGSLLMSCAKRTSVSAGSALAVDRHLFSVMVTNALTALPNIEVCNTICTDFTPKDGEVVIVASGPLTNSALHPALEAFAGKFLHFFDAVAPIVTAESLDYDSAFCASRYGKGGADYINCPMNKQEFEVFYDALINAKTAQVRDFEQDVFEGCMPIEVMAGRGRDAIRYGMLKPVGLSDPRKTERPYAVLQLRKENQQGSLLNLVGCQTHLTFSEQKRVFSLIPALARAEFVRYGVMHKNTYIDSPSLLTQYLSANTNPYLFFAGQITGVEGYVESIASGLLAGINAYNTLLGKRLTEMPKSTMIGALASHVSTFNANYAPMNANFGILPELEVRIRDKKEKKTAISMRSLQCLDEVLRDIEVADPNRLLAKCDCGEAI